MEMRSDYLTDLSHKDESGITHTHAAPLPPPPHSLTHTLSTAMPPIAEIQSNQISLDEESLLGIFNQLDVSDTNSISVEDMRTALGYGTLVIAGAA